MRPGTKAFQAAIDKAARERPYHDKRFHPYHIEGLESEFTDKDEKSWGVHEGLRKAQLGVIKNIAGKPAEARPLLADAMASMEESKVSPDALRAAALVNLQSLSKFRGRPHEVATNRIELACAMLALGDVAEARTTLVGALVHLGLKKAALPKPSNAMEPQASPANTGGEDAERIEHRSTMAVFVSIFAAKLSLNLGEEAQAADYLTKARRCDAANRAAGLPGADIPSVADLREHPLFVVSEGIGPTYVKLGTNSQYVAVVPGRSPGVKAAFVDAGGKRVDFTCTKPTGDMTLEAQMEARSGIEEFVEEHELRGDDRSIGFVHGNHYHAQIGPFAEGKQRLTFAAETTVCVAALFADKTFVRTGSTVELNLTKQSIFRVRIVPDYPPSCTTAEQARELDRAKATEAPKKPPKVVQRILDNTRQK